MPTTAAGDDLPGDFAVAAAAPIDQAGAVGGPWWHHQIPLPRYDLVGS